MKPVKTGWALKLKTWKSHRIFSVRKSGNSEFVNTRNVRLCVSVCLSVLNYTMAHSDFRVMHLMGLLIEYMLFLCKNGKQRECRDFY